MGLVLGVAGVCGVGLPAAASPTSSRHSNRWTPTVTADFAAEDAAVAARMFETMDANRDHKVTVTEMAAAYQKTTGTKGIRARPPPRR